MFAALPDHWRRVDRILEVGDTVAVWPTFGATASATQTSFEVEVCDIIEVRDGRITWITMYGDWAPMYPALQG
jgi:ketosteroid isomerase-like protein